MLKKNKYYECGTCEEYGHIIKARVRKTNEIIYFCEECDSVFPDFPKDIDDTSYPIDMYTLEGYIDYGEKQLEILETGILFDLEKNKFKETFVHEVIGRIYWDLWNKRKDYFHLKSFKIIEKYEYIQILFAVSEENKGKIPDIQVQKYQEITENSSNFFEMVYNSILKYYNEIYKDLKKLPEISNLKDLEKVALLEDGLAIYINDNFIKVFMCIFEEEHEISVKIQDEDVWRNEKNITESDIEEAFQNFDEFLIFQNGKVMEVGLDKLQ